MRYGSDIGIPDIGQHISFRYRFITCIIALSWVMPAGKGAVSAADSLTMRIGHRIKCRNQGQPLTYLFNLSLQQYIVPHQWNYQLHHTFAKSQFPSCVSSLPPYFCHSHSIQANGKKSLVKQLLNPVLIHPHCSHLFSDQFGFRPTGSNTAAFVYVLHQISQLLQCACSCIGFLESL